MSDELRSLTHQYGWLRQQLTDNEGRLEPSSATALTHSMNDIFLRIVKFPADDPSISYKQIAFLLQLMAETDDDRDLRALLSREVLTHVKRLADRVRHESSPSLGGQSS